MPNVLTKKLGPAPVWAWGLGALLLVAMVIYIRRSPSADNSVELTPPDDGMIRGDDGSEYTGLVGGGVGNIGGGTGTPYVDPLPPADYYYPPAPMEPLLPIFDTPQYPTDYQPEPTPPPAPVQVATPKVITPAKQTSFQWGGKTWYKKDYAAFKAWLKKRGVTYATWAKNHPKAAMDVFGKMT